MQIEAKDGSKTLLQDGLNTHFGRLQVFKSNDRTVSRHHVSFLPHTCNHEDETMVSFEVIGKNPIWVHNKKTDQIRVFRRFETGEMESGDMLCVSGKDPFWFSLKRIDFEGESGENTFKRESIFEDELGESLHSSCGLRGVDEVEVGSVDVSDIDPVKEFGFVVMGHEFECYPKKMIHDIKNWDWFLEEPGEESNDDDDEVQEKKEKKKGGRRKRKKGEANDDENEEWTGDSEDEKEVITKIRKVQRPKYSTRSKDQNKDIKDKRKSKRPAQNTTRADEEDDDTLGGFIVIDDDVEVEEESDEDDEEGEEDDFDEDEEELD